MGTCRLQQTSSCFLFFSQLLGLRQMARILSAGFAIRYKEEKEAQKDEEVVQEEEHDEEK